MKAAVYYFTGTGNSLAVARDIAKSLEGELISIPSVIQQELVRTDAEVIGVVFPVYIWGMPLIVERFIKKLANLQDKYVFAITTYGGMPGATRWKVGEELAYAVKNRRQRIQENKGFLRLALLFPPGLSAPHIEVGQVLCR